MNKGNDLITTFVGGCFTLVILFILFVFIVGVIA